MVIKRDGTVQAGNLAQVDRAFLDSKAYLPWLGPSDIVAEDAGNILIGDYVIGSRNVDQFSMTHRAEASPSAVVLADRTLVIFTKEASTNAQQFLKASDVDAGTAVRMGNWLVGQRAGDDSLIINTDDVNGPAQLVIERNGRLKT